MAMVSRAKRWTLDELHRLPDDGNKYEVVFGELFVTPAPSEEHEMILARLNALLVPYVAAYHLGAVFRPRAVVRWEGSEVEPDLFVRALRPVPKKDWEGAPVPLLVVEVLSPTTRRRDLSDKRRLYLVSGVGEYWVVDPELRNVRVMRADTDDVFVDDQLTWTPTDAPRLVIRVPELFDRE